MIKLRQVSVGPIVGETRHNLVRLWGRAGDNIPSGIRVHGIARLLLNDRVKQTILFKMERLWDYTGVAVFENLRAQTRYDYQIAWFISDDEIADLTTSPPKYDWSEIDTHSFRTGIQSRSASRSYFIGSCRYNLPWSDDDKDPTDTRGDKTFKAMLAHRELDQISGLIMLGDQIYADILGMGVETREGFFRLYRGAFRQESLQAVMQRIPTYMTLDDHEIEDNWPSRKSVKDIHKEASALYAYQAYQISHSPLISHANGRLAEVPDRFWYEFQDGCCEIFMMDVRTERDLESKEMISEDQMHGLISFLKNGSDLVKLIGTSVPLVTDGGSDKWSGFKQQRGEILDCIRKNRIKNVIFISGDVHFSAAYDLRCEQDPDFKVLSFVCSPFFWPFPHIARLKLKPIEHNEFKYLPSVMVKPYRKENFVRLSVNPSEVKFEVYPRKGVRAVRRSRTSLQ